MSQYWGLSRHHSRLNENFKILCRKILETMLQEYLDYFIAIQKVPHSPRALVHENRSSFYGSEYQVKVQSLFPIFIKVGSVYQNNAILQAFQDLLRLVLHLQPLV